MTRFLRTLTLHRLVVAITFIAIFVMAVRVPLDTDTFWHLRAGEWMIQERQLLRTDVFSHTRAGQGWINHSYLSQLLLYGVYAALGDVGLALYVAVLATLGMAFVYRLCSGDVFIRAFTLVIAASTAAVFWSPRPQMVSFALSAVVLFLLYRYLRDGVDRLWLVPPIMLLWVNMHGGFAISFILMVLALIGEILRVTFDQALRGQPPEITGARRLVVIGLVSAVLVSINPYGPQMLLYPFRTVGISVLRDFIVEWRSPDFHQLQVWPFAWMLLGLIAAVGLSRRRLDWRDLTLVAGTGYLGLLAGRNIAVFAIVAAPVLTHHAHDWLSEVGWRPRLDRAPARGPFLVVNWLLLLLVLVAGGVKIAFALDPMTIQEARTDAMPEAAVAYLEEERPAGPMFNSYNWGGYLIWSARDYPVYVDGRTDLYDDQLLTVYLSIYFVSDEWASLLDEAGINLIFVEVDSPLAKIVAREPGWSRAYADEQAVIYTRE
jgi:hypothetical protein